ncbi:unnamed protein product, partial [marine sediment metagenome]
MNASSPDVGAIVVAAGSSTRMGDPSTGSGQAADKLFVPVAGRPLLAHVLAPVQECPLIHRIVLVVSSANLQRGRDLVAQHGLDKVSAVCQGGPRR